MNAPKKQCRGSVTMLLRWLEASNRIFFACMYVTLRNRHLPSDRGFSLLKLSLFRYNNPNRHVIISMIEQICKIKYTSV